MLDVASLVTDFDVGPLALTRRGAPVRTSYGDYTDAAPTVSYLSPVAVHTVEGRDIQQVPEADRHKEMTKFYTLVRLHVSDSYNDVVTWDGRDWRIVTSYNFGPQGGVYIAIGVLEDA